jgi:hypothetical protein
VSLLVHLKVHSPTYVFQDLLLIDIHNFYDVLFSNYCQIFLSFFVIILIVRYPPIWWLVGLFIPSCNYPFCSLLIFNHITSCS